MLNGLFPPDDACRAAEDRLTGALAAAAQRVRRGAAVPDLDLAAFEADLGTFDFERPRPLDDLCDWAIDRLEHGGVNMTHPRHLGLFNPAPSLPARLADRIVASFNPQLASATTSPAAVAIEAHVIRAFAGRAGLPPGAGGHFTSGGSEANATALTCALTNASPSFGQDGVRAFAGPPVFYISADSHLAWIKIAHIAGIGRTAARLVPAVQGRIDPAALSEMIEADRGRGAIPVMVVATAGTTNAGAIDDLAACRAAARASGAWFHVDAAWGGALLTSDDLRPLLAGIEAADSITIDAHKWLATTMACGMILVARPGILAEAFDVRTSFMPSHTPSLDPYLTTQQWSRRFMGLRLFLALGAAGWAGYAAHVERGVALGRRLASGLERRNWRILNDPAMAVVCAAPAEGGVRGVVERVVRGGQAWVSVAGFGGQEVLRACVTNGRTTEADIDAAIDAIEGARTSAETAIPR